MLDNLKNNTGKTLLLAVLLTAFPPTAIAQGWEVIDFPLSENITGISFVHPDTGHLVTSGGKHARTFDGGKSWWGLQITAGSSLEDVHFLDALTGYVCGRRGAIHRTLNGGDNWQTCSWPDTTVSLISIRMLDIKTGLAVGLVPMEHVSYGGIALRTTDGGQTWKKLDIPGLAFGDIFRIPGKAVGFLSWGNLNFSRDKGITWQSVKTLDGKPGRMVAFAGHSGIMVGNSGMCAYTDDKGKNKGWHLVDLADDERHFTCAVMIDENTGYIGGTKASIFKTTDGGRNWNQELMAKSFDVFALCIIGDWLWAVGADGGIIRKKVR